MKKSSRNKKFVTLKLLLILLLIILLPASYIAITRFNFTLPFSGNTKLSSTEAILREINKTGSFSTVEYIYKSVFPFDFIDKDTIWEDLLKKRSKNEFLTSVEIEKLKLYDLCKTIGIDLLNKTYDFVVITSRVEAGFNLEKDLNRNNLTIEGKKITIQVPEITVTKFIIEDMDSSNYPYPDFNVDPIHWKAITAYVEDKIRDRIIEDGVLINAKERGLKFIKSILSESGWENIYFIE
ncbi:MAG: DUF4230 domain-containing protein [Spirochaetales bacterium]|nr:DUF4230 domain-containing protein [Spirochaetales bacterium]